MVNRVAFLIFIIFFSINNLYASNLLKGMNINNARLKLTFKHSLKKGDLIASAIKGSKLTKYIFDFKKCYLKKGVKNLKNLNYPIKSIRVAQYKSSMVRLVIDSYKPYVFRYYQKNNPNFYIELPKVSLKNKTSIKNLFSNINLKQDKKVKKSKTKKIAKVISTIYSTNLKKSYTIVIDPGHGGHDPGTVNGRYKEKVVVLQIAKRVYNKLKNLGFKVYLTRYKDRFIKLSHRTRKANRLHADVFVSIHANSISNKAKANIAHGLETYFLQTTRNARAKRIAAKENAEFLKGKDLATKRVLLNAVFTGPKIALSNRLAIDIQSHILVNLRSKYRGVRDNGVRGAPFYVLAGAEMPSVLIETGYLSNPKEKKRLSNPNYQELLAKGIVEGIVRYLKNREKELE